MRALLPLVLLVLAPLAMPVAAAGECARVAPLDTALSCERTGPQSCHFVVSAAGTVALDRTTTCPPHACRPTDVGRVDVRCSEPEPFGAGGTYSTTVTAEVGTGSAALPHGTLVIELSRPAGDLGSIAGHCRARYERFSGPGPSSLEVGRDCAYPFLLP